MSSIEFDYPYLLLLIPLFLWCLRKCPQSEDSLLFSTTKFLQETKKSIYLIDIFKLLSIIFFIVALSSPYTTTNYQKKDSFTNSIAIAVDISESMQEQYKDVQNMLLDYINSSKNTLFSLVYFGDDVAVASALTSDKEYLLKIIKHIKASDLGEMDTKLYDAIIISKRLLKKAETNSKRVLLITDGKDKNSKTTIEELFLDIKDIPIDIIGLKDQYDKKLLQTIAKRSNGNFYEVTQMQKLKNLPILKQNKKELSHSKLVKKPLYQLPLFFAFLSLLFYTYLLNKRAVI